MRLPSRRRIALEPFASLNRVHALAAVERGEAPSKFLVELGKLIGARLLVFFQKAESLPDDLTGGIVAASLYLACNKSLKLGR
jgi:hypothetical protein